MHALFAYQLAVYVYDCKSFYVDIMQVKGVNVICEEEDQPNVQCNAAWNVSNSVLCLLFHYMYIIICVSCIISLRETLFNTWFKLAWNYLYGLT